MIKRPLLGMVVSLIIGLLFSGLELKMNFLIAFLIILLLYVARWIRWLPCKFTKEDWHRYLWPIFFLLGVIRMGYTTTESDLELAIQTSQKAKVYGEIVDLVQKGDSVTLWLDDINVHLTKTDQWYEDKKAIVYLDSNKEYTLGNQVMVEGTILGLSKSTNSGQFNEYSYYKAKDVICKVYAKQVTITDNHTSLFFEFVLIMKQQLTKQMIRILPSKEAGLINAILFGDKALLLEEDKELYQENGLSHIMAVSGLHISLLGYGLYRLLRRLSVPVILCALLPSLFLIFYLALAGFALSAQRAVLMFFLMMLGVFLGTYYDMLSSLSLAAIILLLRQPYCLFDAGFLLSFTCVLGIALLYPRLAACFIKEKDPWAKLKQPLLLSISTQLITLPIVCYFFYEITPYSILMNLIVIPLSSYLVFVSLISCFFSFFSLALGQFCIGGVFVILKLLSLVLHLPEYLPYHLILIGKPALTMIFGYYMVLAGIYSMSGLEKTKISWCFSVFLFLFLKAGGSQELEVNFLDVSQGDCAILTFSGNVIMIDGGSLDEDQVYQYRIKPYLKSKGIRHINQIYLSHADTDHMSGVMSCIAEMKENTVYMKDYNGEITIGAIILPKLTKYEEKYQDIIRAATLKKIPIQGMAAGEETLVEDMSIKALSPKENSSIEDSNNTSLVLHIKKDDFIGIFTGDVDASVEAEILHNYSELLIQSSVSLLKIPHHGSKYSSSKVFLETVDPKVAVISAGVNNRYGHPHTDTLQRLEDVGCEIWNTAKSGQITVEVETHQEFLNVEVHGWNKPD